MLWSGPMSTVALPYWFGCRCGGSGQQRGSYRGLCALYGCVYFILSVWSLVLWRPYRCQIGLDVGVVVVISGAEAAGGCMGVCCVLWLELYISETRLVVDWHAECDAGVRQ